MSEFKIITALVTPFLENGKVDYLLLKKNIDYQLKNEIDTFVIFSTTGEGSTIPNKEKRKIIDKLNKDYKNIHLYLGIASICTTESVNDILYFNSSKLDGYLVLTPTFMSTNEAGLYQHFKAVSLMSNKDIIVYHVEKRTGQKLSLEVLRKIKKLDKVIGLKDASNEANQYLSLQDENFKIYLGNDLLLDKAIETYSGVISVISNAYPKTIKAIIKDRSIFDKYQAYFELLFEEANPIPIKFLLTKLAFSTNIYHLPLYNPSKELIDKLMKSYMGDNA